MARMIKQGRLDFIGCARPSIADPFLPKKIDEGRIDDIRECIGCNICVTGDMTQGMGRCTQNPTWMEEWRRGWHPEKIAAKGESQSVLIIGSGPAGLEAARAAALRGYDVAVAEALDSYGGRVARERQLPGLSAWGRVADYRLYQLGQRPNVQMYPGSRLTAEEVLAFGFQHICVATGSTWRADGVARQHVVPMPINAQTPIFTPDDLMAGRIPSGRVVVFDDDHYYMGGVLAELCAQKGCDVTLVTPSAFVSDWTANTLEQSQIHRRLAGLGVAIRLNTGIAAVQAGGVETSCTYTDTRGLIECDALVLVTSRTSDDGVFLDLMARQADWADAGIRSVKVIGDAAAPAPIAWATHAGHRYARDLDAPDLGDALPFRREVTRIED
jgi:dimethylamine/trimethylamine dehydrogenase